MLSDVASLCCEFVVDLCCLSDADDDDVVDTGIFKTLVLVGSFGAMGIRFLSREFPLFRDDFVPFVSGVVVFCGFTTFADEMGIKEFCSRSWLGICTIGLVLFESSGGEEGFCDFWQTD